MKHITALVAAIAVGTAAMPAQFNLQRFTALKANDYGLAYSLPVTALEITLQTRHRKVEPGEFYNYARRHLAINNAVTEPSTTAELVAVDVRAVGVADPSHSLHVQFKAGAQPFVLLTPEGIPLAVNTETLPEPEATTKLEAQPAAPTILETEFARQAMTQDMIRSSSVSKRAELAAARIFELRDMRNELLSGQADNPPADGKAMQLVLDNIAGQESALTAMFAGTEQTWTTVRTVTVVPDSLGNVNSVIARISPFEGILDADNLAGAPVTITLKVVERGTTPLNDKGEPRKLPKNAFGYCVPGTARLGINFNGQEIASYDVTLAQLGVKFGLDPAIFTDKKEPSQLRLDPATGAILLLGPADK